MAESEEPDSSPLGPDATVRHIRLIRAQLKRLSGNEPQGATDQPSPVDDRGQPIDASGFTATSPT
ncbi:MAG TPA: hypothetical protein VFK43_06905, partial [Acidimicrobiales bacterium]|nr:hypothetical protein [Acidimicrobiales bacterium]